jgi:hypothetical protein
VFPMRGNVGTRLIQVHMLIDVIDPGNRDEMMMLAVGRTLFRKLDFVGPVEMVDLSDRLAVGRNDVHVFRDLRRVGHATLNAAPIGKLHLAEMGKGGSVPRVARRDMSESALGDIFRSKLWRAADCHEGFCLR